MLSKDIFVPLTICIDQTRRALVIVLPCYGALEIVGVIIINTHTLSFYRTCEHRLRLGAATSSPDQNEWMTTKEDVRTNMLVHLLGMILRTLFKPAHTLCLPLGSISA